MKFKITCIILFFIICITAFTQTKKAFPIKDLIQDSLPVAFIRFNEEHLLPIPEGDEMKQKRELFIKKGNNLYVFVDGSGRLYKTLLDSLNDYTFKRIDSTTHFGYNIGSFGFCYNNRIYNLGGYGIWRINGQLRVFNEVANEWDIVKLNKEIPFMGDASLLWYDLAGKKIYIGYYTPKNEAEKTTLKEFEFVDDVMVLDLVTNEWSKLGTLNPYIKENLPNSRIITHSPWGLLIYFSDKICLLDYRQNKFLSLSESYKDYQTLNRQLHNKNIYFKDSTLFWGNNTERTLDSIQLHYADFVPTGQSIYLQHQNREQLLLIVLIIFLILLIFAFLTYKFKKKAHIYKPAEIKNLTENELKNEQVVIDESYKNNDIPLFEPREKQVLELIIEKSQKAEITNTDDLNRVLGLSKKAIEIQKKQRSDVIISINKKYAFISKSNEILIDKKRAEVDKRSFEYFIEFEKLALIKKYI